MGWEVWRRFAKLFQRRITTLVGVDFGQGAVKVVEVSLKGARPYLRTLAIVEVPTAYRSENVDSESYGMSGLKIDSNLLKTLLHRALAVSGIKAKDAVLAIGGKWLFMREVTFPELPPEELAEAIKWDIPKYVPYEPDSYEFDYSITGQKAETGELRVLIAAAPKKAVRQLTKIAREVGLKPLAVDIEPLAVQRTMVGAENAMVVDVGAENTQISLFQQGNPVFTRVVSVRGSCIEAALKRVGEDAAAMVELESIVAELGQEVGRTAQFFTQQNKQATIDKVIVSGFTENEKLVDLLRAKVDLPVVEHEPLAGLEVNRSFATDYLRQVGPQLAVAIGLALRGAEA
ncbi:MAG: type pilus assembly protein PilM [Firmicutes bacterium]|nr:type pilus assembly protein PilM [Bacillota bacterium]